MELTQIIVLVGVAFIVSAAITSYLFNRKQSEPQLPYNASITKDVMDQIIKKAKVLPEDTIIDLGKSDQTSKPKKKRKYYPKKPKTNI